MKTACRYVLSVIFSALFLFAPNRAFAGMTLKEVSEFKRTKLQAEYGDVVSEYNLGNCYYNGQGTQPDTAEAVIWFNKAADKGLPQAQYNLAIAYYVGKGVGQDFAKAFTYFKKAADQGLAPAEHKVGLCYYFGEGVDKDYGKAFAWARKAAWQSFAPAQGIVGNYYYQGKGVSSNLVESYAYYVLAIKSDPTSRKPFELMANSMSAEERLKGQQRAAELQREIESAVKVK
jgi:TPR repeat protein